MYGAGVAGAVLLAYRSRSTDIKTAARLIFISWAFSLQLWLLFDGAELTLAYLVVDIALAAAFFQLSRGRWFPAPLFFLHVLIIAFHLYALAIDQGPFWMLAFLNRSFELALVYIIVCALYRIRRTG